MNTPIALLNKLTVEQFLAEYWQKKPLLIRQAIPDFHGLLDPNDLAGLACEDDVQSRIVRFQDDVWKVDQGPFNEGDFSQLPKEHWTLLVQSVNHYLPEAQDLMNQFAFIPYARLDDLMVSYAPKGGGVGPHLDSYDVFLLQGSGQRLWRISQQTDHRCIEDAPLRILKDFQCEHEWVLNPGDMLYLPPHVAHWGISQDDDCMTYSIGFRSPKAMELAAEYLSFGLANIADTKLYQDPDLSVQDHPAEVSKQMAEKVHTMFTQLDWSPQNIGPFLARYLSEPKMHVVFEPNPKINLKSFAKKIITSGLALDLKSQMLYWDNQYYLNGETASITDNNDMSLMKAFANQRHLSAEQCLSIEQSSLLPILHEYYLLGYCQLP